jgi:hypothetical protein
MNYTHKNGGGLFGRSRKVAPINYANKVAPERHPNNTMNNTTRKAVTKRDKCLGRCQVLYKKNSLSKGSRINWSGYLDCCKMCRKETPYTRYEMMEKEKRKNNNGNNNKNNNRNNNSSVSASNSYII